MEQSVIDNKEDNCMHSFIKDTSDINKKDTSDKDNDKKDTSDINKKDDDKDNDNKVNIYTFDTDNENDDNNTVSISDTNNDNNKNNFVDDNIILPTHYSLDELRQKIYELTGYERSIRHQKQQIKLLIEKIDQEEIDNQLSILDEKINSYTEIIDKEYKIYKDKTMSCFNNRKELIEKKRELTDRKKEYQPPENQGKRKRTPYERP